MAPYNNYNNYYNPVGNQSEQPQGYTYQQSSTDRQYSTQSDSNYPGNSFQGYGNTYGSQQYPSNSQQSQLNANHNRSTSSFRGVNPQNYSQSGSSNPSYRTAAQYDGSAWTPQNLTAPTFAAVPSRSQASGSPLDPDSHSTSVTFGRGSAPDQTPSSSVTFDGSQGEFPTAKTYPSSQSNNVFDGRSNPRTNTQGQLQTQPRSQAPQQPQRYSSPLQAVQAQQHMNQKKQSSRSSTGQPASQMVVNSMLQDRNQAQRAQSASVEPSPATIDPSQVYDIRAEQQRKAQIEAEKRRIEAERAELDARAAAREADEGQASADQRMTEEAEAKRKAAQVQENEQRGKVREEKRHTKTAATPLQQLASSGGESTGRAEPDMATPSLNDEEAEMRAMFKKMREFNAKNPAMLAQLWEEERKAHAAQSLPPQQANVAPAPAPQRQASKASAAAAVVHAPDASPNAQSSALPQLRSSPKPPAQSPPQPSPVSAPGTQLWPPHKKGAIAESAAKWLNALLENKSTGGQVSSDDIVNILDGNPSYVQLCESIEKSGIRFERSALARQLLKVGSDNSKPQSQPQHDATLGAGRGAAAQISGATAANTPRKRSRAPHKETTTANRAAPASTVNYQAPSFATSLYVPGEGASAAHPSAVSLVPGEMTNNYQSPYFSHHVPHPSSTRSQPPEVKVEPAPPEPSCPPADKEEAARKRTFGDLVDLTADDSDDERPPKKVYQLPNGQHNGIALQDQQKAGLTHPTSFQQYMFQGEREHSQATHGPINPFVPYQPPPATFSVPLQWTPNAPSIQPPAPPFQEKVPSQEQLHHQRLQVERMKGNMLVEPIMRDRVARKSRYDSRTIARDVLLATGRHPDMGSLNAHLNPMQKLLSEHGGTIDGGGNKSDLSTIRWDIIDPGGPAETNRAKANRTFSVPEDESNIKASHNVDDAGDADDKGEPGAAARSEQRAKVSSSSKYISEQQPRPSENNNLPPKRRRRPRLSRPDSRQSSATPSNLGEEKRKSRGSGGVETPRMSVPHPALGSGAATGYRAFQQFDEFGNKKKGRPVGWRKNIHSYEAQGLVPPKSQPAKLPVGRPRQSHTPSDKIIEPRYAVYTCQWANCDAELHNLDTLKKHLVKVHGRPNDKALFRCLWEVCDSRGLHVDASGEQTQRRDGKVATFDTIEIWLDHIQKEHVQRVAWELGDGPKSDHSVQDSDAYLSDAQGRSVTPIILPAPPSSGTSMVERLSTRPGNGAMTKDEREALAHAEAELEKLKQQKRAEGVVMGQEGSKLVNKKRRLGFLDDEDFEDVIESEGE